MDLRHLRYFVAVAQELHFGRAAARLHIAQPPLSRQIRDLEEELGVRLFSRDRRKVVLTAAGQVFLREIGPLFGQLEQAVDAARRAERGEIGTLHIGYVGAVVYSALPEIIRAFRARLPQVEVRLQEMSPAAQIEGLLRGHLEVGFARGPIEEPALDVETVLDEALVAALPAGHPLNARRRLRLATLRAEPFVVTARSRGPGYYDHIITICRDAGFSPRVVQEGSHFDVLSLVAAGCGVAIVPVSMKEIRRGDVVYRPLLERPRTQLVMASRRDATLPVLREFLASVRRLGGRGIHRRSRKSARASA
jgi:DNA-binding transcriptional LysR family regulator